MRLGRAKAEGLAFPLSGAAMVACLLLAGTAAVAEGDQEAIAPTGIRLCLAEYQGAPEEEGLDPYSFVPVGDGIVAYQTKDLAEGTYLDIVENCAAGDQMVWSRPVATSEFWAPEPLRELYQGMLYGDAEVTLADIARRLAQEGETTELRRVSYESCGCRMLRDN